MNELKTCYKEKNLKMTFADCCKDSSNDLSLVSPNKIDPNE